MNSLFSELPQTKWASKTTPPRRGRTSQHPRDPYPPRVPVTLLKAHHSPDFWLSRLNILDFASFRSFCKSNYMLHIMYCLVFFAHNCDSQIYLCLLLHVAVVCSFYCFVVFYRINIPPLIHQFQCLWTYEYDLFLVFGCYK